MNKKQIYGVLGLILLVAIGVRVLPYILGYENLVMGDTIREYEQALFIENEGTINFDFIYGMYPALHLLVAETSLMTGLDTDMLFRFLPQFFAALASIIVFLLMREQYNPKIALISAFLVAVFGQHILWSMKPVRETIGLFIFPFLVYMYYKANTNDRYLVPLALTSIVAIFSHHWSLLLALIFLGVFLLPTNNLKLLFTYLATCVAAFTYFYVTLNSVQSFFGSVYVFLMFLLLFVASYLFLSKYVAQYNLDSLRKRIKAKVARINDLEVALLLAFIALTAIAVLLLSINEYLVYSYSWFFFSSIILLSFFAVLGLLPSMNDYPLPSMGFLAVTAVYFGMITFGLLVGYEFFDPGRVAEFLIYPLALFASVGIMYAIEFAKSTTLQTILATGIFILFFLSGIFVIPMVYVSGEATEIRSYLQYVPIEGNWAVDWVYDNSGLIITDNTYVMAIYDLLQYKAEKETTSYYGYISEYDIAAANISEDVNIDSIGSEIDQKTLEVIMSGDLVYSNGWAYVYKISEDEYESLYRQNPYSWFWGDKQ